jgi:hypothetical protein
VSKPFVSCVVLGLLGGLLFWFGYSFFDFVGDFGDVDF